MEKGRIIMIEFDKNILYDLYINNHMRMKDIAEKYRCSASYIQKWLRKYNIPIRKGGFGFSIHNEIEFTKKQFEFFDGFMASDGSLSFNGKGSNARITTSLKYYEFANYMSNILNLNITKDYWSSDGRFKNGGSYISYLRSENNIFFTKERKRWYPYGRKIIPSDFRFSSTAMNIWYLGDGTRTSFAKSRRCGIVLCTDAYAKENLDDTLIKFLNSISIDAWTNKNNQTYIPRDSVKKFLDYIGKCPVECYKYKWEVEL